MKKLTTLIGLFIFSISPAMASDDRSYRVTVTNATTHHIITPPLLVTHSAGSQLFSVGEGASDGLALQAETGDNSLLNAEVVASGAADDIVAAGAPVFPGESVSYVISAEKKSRLSFTGMLATTNDAFAGLDSVALPKRSATYFAYVYDAGSEINNEDCNFIPGPPCAGPNLRSEAGEGFVSIHNGIYGAADLDQTLLDWRGPVVIIKVERIRD